MYVNAYSPQYLSAFRPEGYGKVAAANRSATSPQVHSNNTRPADKDTHRVMAGELVRRLDLNSVREQEDGQEQSGDSSKHLRLSLSKAFTKVEKEFGGESATAVMGIFAAAIDDGGVSEEAVGEAMIDSIKFMDRNFGFAAGDKLMNLFNRDLNKSVNEYFDNGLTEQIYSKTQVTGAINQAVSKVSDSVMQRFGEEDADIVAEMIRSTLQNADQGLGQALRSSTSDAAAYLEEKYGSEAVAGLGLDLASAVYASGGRTTPPGSMLSVTA